MKTELSGMSPGVDKHRPFASLAWHSSCRRNQFCSAFLNCRRWLTTSAPAFNRWLRFGFKHTNARQLFQAV